MAIVLFAGCQKEEIPTTYTFVGNNGVFAGIYNLGYDNDYKTAEISIVLAEYYQGQCVATHLITHPLDGKKYINEASSKAEYVTVRIDVEYTDNYFDYPDFEKILYIANAFYLEPGKDILIEMHKDTLTSSKEPK